MARVAVGALFTDGLVLSWAGHCQRHVEVERMIIFTHVLNAGRCPVCSPLDQLAGNAAVIPCGSVQSIVDRDGVSQ